MTTATLGGKNRLVKPEIGGVFGYFEILEYIPKDQGESKHQKCLCICRCGVKKIVRLDHVLSGASASCGCFKREQTSKSNKTHGMTQTPEYHSWSVAKRRCYNKNVADYPRYGGRGIEMCSRWKDSFENFYSDMGKKPSVDHSLDRIDVNGNYEPGNCRWATDAEQCRNRRTNVLITDGDKTMCLIDYCKITGVNYGTAVWRIRMGMDPKTAATKPATVRTKTRRNS